VDDSKNLSDYETLNAANSQPPKTKFQNLQKRSCFIVEIVDLTGAEPKRRGVLGHKYFARMALKNLKA